MTLEIAPLAPGLQSALLGFFEGPAFADNPKWAGCYCAFNYLDHKVVRWAERSGVENRATMCGLIDTGHAEGWLALRDGQVVGWLNAAPRARYPGYAKGNATDEHVGVASCFVIAPAARRQGVARALLEAAIAGFAQRGFVALEAWPNRIAESAAAHYHGPLAMYLAAGFEIVRDAGDDKNDDLIAVRKTLATSPTHRV
jgi:GNAT superfamily N-acetyltransferase